MDHEFLTQISNFLSTRSPLEYTAITGWAINEILVLMKSAKIKSIGGILYSIGKAVYKAVQQVEIFEKSVQGQAIIAEVKKDISTEAPK